MGAKTVKRLAILVTTILVAGLSIFFIQRYQVGRMDRSVLAQAARAENDGNFEEAVRFYQEHFEVAPDDPEAKLKYADVLLKGPKNDARQAEAARLYNQHVTRFPDDKITRRRLAELDVEMGQYNVARPHLELLSNSEREDVPKDGALHFLLGRCQEKDDPSRAQCYHRLGDRDREREAYKSSILANPKDVQARWGLAESLADRGEIDNAIREYRQLVDQLQQEQRDAELPAIRRRLAQLLIARNQQLAVGQRDWTEVEKLVREFTPQSNEWVILQTELLVAQEKIGEAQDLLEKARSRTSPDFDLWIKSAELLRRQRKFDDARKLLDQAQKALGESIALRLERSRLLTVQGGADLPKAIAAPAENTASFSPTDLGQGTFPRVDGGWTSCSGSQRLPAGSWSAWNTLS